MGSAIQKLYTKIPSTYELINHLLTLGMDIRWRKNAIKKIEISSRGRWIDVCTGTGETAAYLFKYAKNGHPIFATDFSLPMVRLAKSKPEGKVIQFSISEIKSLPFPDDTFDLITISFATRNIDINRQTLIQSFSEIRRVLKSGGQFINLETSQPENSFIRYLFHMYVKTFIKPIGTAISGSKSAYAYLASTMSKFYNAGELRNLLIESGFKEVNYQQMLFGAAAIHSSIK